MGAWLQKLVEPPDLAAAVAKANEFEEPSPCELGYRSAGTAVIYFLVASFVCIYPLFAFV